MKPNQSSSHSRRVYVETLAKFLPPEEAAIRLAKLAKDERGGIAALKALEAALEHMGIVESKDERRILIAVANVMVSNVLPLILNAVPAEYHGQIRAAMRQALEEAINGHESSSLPSSPSSVSAPDRGGS